MTKQGVSDPNKGEGKARKKKEGGGSVRPDRPKNARKRAITGTKALHKRRDDVEGVGATKKAREADKAREAELLARKVRIFLSAISEGGTIVTACAVSGIPRSTFKDWRATRPDFAAAFQDAREEAVERLEAAAYHRSLHGVSEPVVQLGQIVMDPATADDPDGPKPLMVTKYPENMAMFMLKALNPDKYRERPPEKVDTTVVMQITEDDSKL